MSSGSKNSRSESLEPLKIQVQLYPDREVELYALISKCDQRRRAELLRRLAYMGTQKSDEFGDTKVSVTHHTKIVQSESGEDVSRAVFSKLPIDYLS